MPKLLQDLLDWLNPRLPNHRKDGLYYECHVTVEPVLDPIRLEQLKVAAKIHGFRVADLLMLKRKADTPERSKFDTFMTGHALTYRELEERMIKLVRDAQMLGFTVWRYKIEDTIIDSRKRDSLTILKDVPK